MDERPATGEFHPRAVVLVEGTSDRRALETLATRRGRDLATEGVSIEVMGGSKAVGRFLTQFGPHGAGVRVAGLCDVGEENDVRRGLGRAGFGSPLTRSEMEALGFFLCEVDLEDELIRALGARAVEKIIDGQGELASLRTLQQQPAQRGRPVDQQLRRFMGTQGGRKIRYAPLLVEALDLARVPRPLHGVLEHVRGRPGV
ncbi:MAG: ATP-dependent endonuclease [Acidimicrobiia bacterium]|nr:ATP-dependent endonuclease [Acidimicrobiia bacterium]